MASIIRIGITKITSNSTKLLPGVCKLQISVRSISSKALRACGSPIKKPVPYDYENKSYNYFKSFFDRTSKRFDENSKLIVVEGPVAAGKSELAKHLAEELDMLYLPEANLDMLYTNDYGYNLKSLDEQLPETCRSFDVNNFLLNPKHRLVAAFQIKQYQVKYSQYIDALAHVFSTGQGVVLDRCPYSDFVFLEAMHKHGYVSSAARSVYYEIRKCTVPEILRPHLVIYLDVPVKKIMENIKNRNVCYEVNSPVLTEDYLSNMEHYYKQEYLKTIGEHAELLIYNWAEEGDKDVVVEDIERINFDKYDKHDKKLADWVFFDEEDYAEKRYEYADNKEFLLTYCNVPAFHVPELLTPAEDAYEARNVIFSAPGMAYSKGYNKAMGDGGLLFKNKRPSRLTLPKIERQ